MVPPVYVGEGTSWSRVLHHSSVPAWAFTKAIIPHQNQWQHKADFSPGTGNARSPAKQIAYGHAAWNVADAHIRPSSIDQETGARSDPPGLFAHYIDRELLP